MITSIGLDAGTSGYSAISVFQGNDWNEVNCVSLEAIKGIDPPDLEMLVLRYCTHYKPNIVIMEENGPGYVFAGYLEKHGSAIPLATINPQAQLPDNYEINLWNNIVISSAEFKDVKAAMCWILRLLFRDNRIRLWFDDDELIAQLGTLRWDNDPMRGDKIFMVSKRKLKFKSSELDTEPFSKSPDKADSLALAALGYATLMQQENETVNPDEVQQEDIIDPIIPGMFTVSELTDEVVEDYAH